VRGNVETDEAAATATATTAEGEKQSGEVVAGHTTEIAAVSRSFSDGK
jgi:hypothetical protein